MRAEPPCPAAARLRSAEEDIVLSSCRSTFRGGFRVAEVEAHITGTVWKIECAVGDAIEEGDTVAILESMKMEMPVEAEDSGTVVEIRCEEGQAVSEGDTLVVLE
jgi:acetyl-CoA carboxylase biotin carboxyl carrier protein